MIPYMYLKVGALFLWFLITSYIFAFKKFCTVIKNKYFRVRKTGNNLNEGKIKILFKKFLDLHHRIKARAILRMFDLYEMSTIDEGLLNYFIKVCSNEKVSSQLISSTAGMAIVFGNQEQALKLLSKLFRCYPLDLSTQQQIGVKAFIRGEYKLAETIWTKCNVHRDQLIKQRGLDKLKIRFLGPSWFLAIGHIAHIDTYIKYMILSGYGDYKFYYSLPTWFDVPNKNLVKIWEKFITVPDQALLSQLSLEDRTLLQDEFWSLPFEDGRSRMFSHAGSIVQYRWMKEGRSPILSPEDLDSAQARIVLNKLGIPKGSWYVCLHVRESGFHLKWHELHPGTRNADIMTYLPAIREIVNRGGYVIRMGDPSMRPLPREHGIVDYALSKEKSEFMDLYFCATCRFFIGTNSGLGLVPPIFGVKCAMTNWSPVGLPQWYPNDVYIPKLIYSYSQGQALTFKELLLSKAGWLQFEKDLAQEGLYAKDNTPEEIRMLILEMLENKPPSKIETDQYDQLEYLIEEFDSYKGASLSRSFIRSHPELFKNLGLNS